MSRTSVAIITLFAALLAAQPRVEAQVFAQSDIKALIDQAAVGTADPVTVVATLSESNGQFTSAIRELLFAERLNLNAASRLTRENARQSFYPMPAHKVMLRVLEEIGSAESFACVYDAAAGHPDPQIQGACLASLAQGFQRQARSGLFRPDKELIYLFLSRAADTLSVTDLGLRVGDIIRVGLKNWIARGSYRPIPASLRVTQEGKSTGSRPYWQHWWTTRSARIKWDEVSGLFFLPR